MSCSQWVIGSVWHFDDDDVADTVATFLAAKAAKRRRLNTSLSGLDQKKLFLKTKFIQQFNDLNFRVRKSKSGRNSSTFSLICGSDRHDRAPICTFGTSFNWNDNGTATLTYVCDKHSCGDDVKIRAKPLELICASDEKVNETMNVMRVRKKRMLGDDRAEFERSPLPLSPNLNTLKG